MSNFNTDKIDGVSFLNAEEWNQIQDLENLINSSGQTPNTSLINQIPQAVANYVAIADSYTDSGTANNYILTSINTFKSPTAYVDGMRVRFITANANTGASTVNVANLGTKNIKKEDGTTDLTANDIPANNEITLIYRNGVFKIAGLSSVQNTSSTTKGIVYYPRPITISNNIVDPNNDIDFSAGNFIFNDYSGEATAIAMTKKLQSSGSWSAGTGGNMLLSGARANSSTYHLFALYKTDGTTDYGALLGVAGTTPDPTSVLPSGYTKWQLIESIITNSSGNIISFTQIGNRIELVSSIQTHTTVSQAVATETLRTLSAAIPVGRQVMAFGTAFTQYTTGGNNPYLKLYSANMSKATLNASEGQMSTNANSTGPIYGNGFWQAVTNTSAQIKTNGSSGSQNIHINVDGWQSLT